MPEFFAWLVLGAAICGALGSIFVLRLLWHVGSLARDLRCLVRNMTASPPALRR